MKFLKNLKFILKPSFWIMNYSYNIEWDKYLNKLMNERRKLEIIDEYNVQFEYTSVSIWIQNYPYAYATPAFWGKCRPSRLTVERFRNYLTISQL